MNDVRIDLAHAVALGSIDDEDHDAVQQLLDGEDPALRDGEDPALRDTFREEVGRTAEALAALAEVTATPPPAALRDRLLAALAEQPPVAS